MNTINDKVLIAYSSKYGYIREIAGFISKQFHENGLQADLLDLGKTSVSRWNSVHDYKGIIVGAGSTTYSVWNKKAKKFVRINSAYLNDPNKVVGFFFSEPTRPYSLLDPIANKEKLGKSIFTNFKFLPNFYEDFGQVIDFSRKSKLKHEVRNNLKDIVKSIAKKTGLEFDYKGYNDFRDWVKIQEFTQKFSKMIIEGNICKACGMKMPLSTTFCTHCGAKMEQENLM